MERLAESEAGQILRDLAPEAGDQAQAEALAARLGGLPLALRLAGRYLRSEYADIASFDAYRHALDSDRRAIRLPKADPGDPDATGRALVVLTCELSLGALAKRGLPEARPLLRLLSCYAPRSHHAAVAASRRRRPRGARRQLVGRYRLESPDRRRA